MSRRDYFKGNILHRRLENYLQGYGLLEIVDKYEIKTKNNKKKKINVYKRYGKDKIIIIGMMRTAGKTYKVFEFILTKYYSIFLSKPYGKVLYVTRSIGTVERDGNRGTFYSTEETIRKIEKKVPLLKNHKLNICMIAGVAKICHIFNQLEESKDKYKEMKQLITCEDCKLTKTIPNVIDRELRDIKTLTPYITKNLGGKYEVCPKEIQKYYAEYFGNIILISYAMIPYWKMPKEGYPFIIFDESRHFTDLPNISIASVTIKKGVQPKIEDYLSVIQKQFLPESYVNTPDEPEWHKKAWYYIDAFGGFLNGKLRTLNEINSLAKKLSNPFDEKIIKERLEYKGRLVFHHSKEHPPGVFQGVSEDNFLDDYIGNKDPEKIHYAMYGLIHSLLKGDIPKEQIKDVKKTINLLRIFKDIAGSHTTEIEILKRPGIIGDNDNHDITLKPFRSIPDLKSTMTFYLEGTPYTKKYFEFWLNLKEDDVEVISIPNDVKITIIYEDAKKSTGQIYGHGTDSTQFRNHIKLIKEIEQLCKDNKLDTIVVARNNQVVDYLGSAGVHCDFVSGNIEAEGTQKQVDMLINEGVQIRNIGVDLSRKYILADKTGCDDPNQIVQDFQDISTTQTMIQTGFRAVDREGNRRNIIIMFGNKMPHKDNKCWIEYAKEKWDYLKSDAIQYVKINGNQEVENKIKDIKEVITNPKFDYDLTPLQNQILQHVNSRPLSKIKKETLAQYFLKSPKEIRRSNSEIRESIKDLVSKRKVFESNGFIHGREIEF
ncbi:hypothetical protein ACFL1L_02475 [Thermoplasmatota archaeon]